MFRKYFVFLLLAVVLLSVLVLASCASTDEPQIDQLSVGVWGGFWGDAYKEAAFDSFSEDTGIQVQMVTHIDDTLAVLATDVERDTPLYDVLWLTDPEFRIAVNSNLLAPIDFTNIEYIEDIYDMGKDPYGISSEIGAWGLAYNKELLDFVPTSWKDMLNPDIGPLVGFIEPDFNGGTMFNLTILAMTAGGSAEDSATLGIEQAKQLARNGAQFGNFGQILTQFTNGEIGLVGIYHQEPIFFEMDGMSVGFVMPEEGAFPVTAWMVMPRNISDSRKLVSEQFMSFVLSPDAQMAIAEQIYSAPINRTVVLDNELAANVHPYGPDEMDSMYEPDWDYTVENLESWIDLWMREVRP